MTLTIVLTVAFVLVVAMLVYDWQWKTIECPTCHVVFVGPRGTLPWWMATHECHPTTPTP